MKKYFFIILLVFVNIYTVCRAQNLTFSNEISSSEDVDIQQIQQLWYDYIYKNDTVAVSKFWHLPENENYVDIINTVFGKNSSLYKFGEQFTFSIRKIDDNFYEINTQTILKRDSVQKDIALIYRVLASKYGEKYKLSNYFDYNKKYLQTYTTKHINYYYSKDYNFDKKRAKQVEKRFAQLLDTYQINIKNKVNYIVGNSLDKCNEMIGFSYSFFRSHLKYAGFSVFPNYILSCKTDHFHELIHAVFRPAFPQASGLLQEGIANYYAGSSELAFKAQIPLLKSFLTENKDIDLSDFNSYNELINERFNPFYTVGALLIDYALKNGGIAKIKEIFNYSTTDEVFEQGFNVPKEQIHTFIYNLIFE